MSPTVNSACSVSRKPEIHVRGRVSEPAIDAGAASQVTDEPADRIGDEPEVVGWRLGLPGLDLGHGSVGLHVEQRVDHLDPGHTVDDAVVDLGDRRPAPVLESFDQPGLPQGPRPVERLGHHAAHETTQLLVAAGRGKGRVPHVVLHGEVRVVHPHRPPESQRDLLDLLAISRHQRQLGLGQGHELVVGRRRPLEDRSRPRCASGRHRPRDRGTPHRVCSSGPLRYPLWYAADSKLTSRCGSASSSETSAAKNSRSDSKERWDR